MRSRQRTRRYVAKYWLVLLRPVLRYSLTRDAFVLRGIGGSRGPVIRPERRTRRAKAFAGVERRRVAI